LIKSAALKTRETSTAFLAAVLIFLHATSSATDSDHGTFLGVKLNTTALTYAKELIGERHVVIDGKGAWAKDQPSTKLENEFIQRHGFGEYAKWHLGIDDRYAENTKRRYKFLYGDFKNVHRCGVLAAKARARQYGHTDIANAAAQLLEMVTSRPRRTAEQIKR
jgi:hypothetical protein